VELPFGGEKPVREEDLVWRRFSEVAMKGGYVELKASAVLLLGQVQSAPIRDTGARFTGMLGYRHTWGEWWALGTFSGGAKDYRAIALGVQERTLGLGVSAGYRWLRWSLVPQVGLGVELLGLEQRLTRDREAELEDTFGTRLPTRHTMGVGLGPVAGLEIPLPAQAFLLAQGQLLVRRLPAESGPALRPAASASVGAGWRF
jgi:hypothetical protein